MIIKKMIQQSGMNAGLGSDEFNFYLTVQFSSKINSLLGKQN